MTEEHPENANAPIISTDEGITNDFNVEQSLNADFPIFVIADGIFISFNDLQPAKTLLFKTVTDDGISI